MKILLLLAILIIATDLRAQVEQPSRDTTQIRFAGEIAVGGSLDADALGIARLNLTITNHRFSLAFYGQYNGSGEIELSRSGGSGRLKRSEPLPDKRSLSDPTALVVSYSPVQRRGRLSIVPSFGIGIGWQAETHYYDGRREHYSGEMWGFGWTEDIYSTRESDHNFLVVSMGLGAEVRLFSFMALTGHAFMSMTGPVSHGWAIGVGVGGF